ncbi:MAG TPA: YHYH protein [Kofleriaceae bacterium]|nr:YHYH protein [Kofleriaceae bacterium]
MPLVRAPLRILTTALLAVPALAACGDDGGSSADAGTDGAQAIDAPTAGRSLDNCTTSIAADVPDFYKRYFKCVTITTTATGVAIQTEDLPPHTSAYYASTDPNYVPFDTRGGSYHKNPNTIAAQSITINVPSSPTPSGATINATTVDGQANTSQEEYALGPVGVALDSVALFTGTAAPGDQIANERFTFDSYEGHPEDRGAYHHHGPTPGPLEALKKEGSTTSTVPGQAEVELYGILCDGTVVLGCTELDGSNPSGPLDAQGGHVGDIRAHDGTTYFTSRYHVHVCADSRGHTYTPEIHYYAACVR